MNDVKNAKLKICFLFLFLLLIQINTLKNIKNINSSQIKEEITKLSSGYKTFKTNKANSLQPSPTILDSISEDLDLGKPGLPLKKLINSEEELIPLLSVVSDSTYIKLDSTNNIVSKYDAKNLLSEDYWCSAGNHGVKDEIKLKIEFEFSTRLASLWLHWAYAPGEFRIQYSNDNSEFTDIFPKKFRYSVDSGNLIWWKKILSNPLTRWHHRSFDDRIDLDKPIFARYITLTMRIPVNKYFGLYRIEFYRKIKSIVMIKSKTSGSNMCMVLANGEFTPGTSVLAKGCIDSLSYGDNRDLFILNSNGFITSFSASNKCLQSPRKSIVDLQDCATSEEYKDDRHKFEIDYTGLIKSIKDPTTCLAVSKDESYISSDQMIVKASSTEMNNSHNVESSINYFSENYWASEATINPVTFSISFVNSVSFTIRAIKILWKFPAKNFKIFGLLSDGNWKDYENVKDNRETNTEHSLNAELKGLKIIMKDASMRIEGKNIYAIINIYLFISGRFVVREQCEKMIDDVNLWEFEDINYTDTKYGLQLKDQFLNLNKNVGELKKIQKLFEEIPKTLLKVIEDSVMLSSKIKDIDESMKGLKFRMVNFEDVLNSLTSVKVNILGGSELYPAMDCTHIKIAFPHKRSGFYWIKSECMSKPLNIYCDFHKINENEEIANDVYIIQLDSNKNNFSSMNKNSKSEDYLFDLRRKCADIGMELLEIRNKYILKLINHLIQFYNFNFGNKNHLIFPIGFDYGIKVNGKKQLSGVFNSLNKQNSENLKKLDIKEKSNKNKNISADKEKEKDKELNLLIESITSQISARQDVLAFSSYSSLIYTHFQDTIITGIACSTNIKIKRDANTKIKHNKEIKCDTSFKTEPFVSSDDSNSNISTVVIQCPSNCAGVNGAYVYGKRIYTDNSSICRAAVHSGVLKDFLGGVVRVNLMSGLNSYEGAVENQVESKPSEQYPRSFEISVYKPFCTLDTFENDLRSYQSSLTKTSFISLEDVINIKDYKENYNENNDDLRLLLRFLQNKYTYKKNITEVNSIQYDTDNSLSNNNNKNNFNLKEQTKSIAKTLTTDEALIEVDSNLKTRSRVILNAKLMSDKLKEIISSIHSELVLYRDDKTGGILEQELTFNNQIIKVEEIKKLIIQLDNLFTLNMIKSEHDFYDLKKRVDKLLVRQNFEEDYSNEAISTNYRIFNSLTGSPIDEPAEWSYYQYNLNGHNTVIRQVNKFADTRTGSHFMIKNREFYDFEFKCSVLIGKDNMDTFGVAFRYVNEFTYYVFEISKREKGFKRLRRFSQGASKVLDFKYDGGYNTDEWINIKIRGQLDNFKVYYTSVEPKHQFANPSEVESSYTLIFDIYDNSLTHGTIALTSFNLNYVLIDSISAVHIACTDFLNDKNSIEAMTGSCNRYRENFKHLGEKWKTYDPLKFEDGPSVWKKRVNYENREVVLVQESRLYGSSDSKEGTIYVLQKRICESGKFSIKLKTELLITLGSSSNDYNNGNNFDNIDNPAVGFIFKFVDENNFYLLEIFNKSMIRLRKKADGIFHLIKMNSNIGYQANTWFKIVLIINDHYFNAIYYKTLDSIGVKVFEEDAYDTTLKTGKIGLWTYKTGAIFGEIEIEPKIEQANQNLKNVLFIDEEKIDKAELNAFNMDGNSEKSFEIINKYENVLNNINHHVTNFSWRKCLVNETKDTRDRTCRLFFIDENQINRCTNNFCGSCCNKFVEKGINAHKFICVKQCKIMERPENRISAFQSFESCINPTNPEQSSYNYCDKLFQFDFYKKGQCKSDMCKLCCVAFDVNKTLPISSMSDELFSRCQSECLKKYVKNKEL